MGREYNLIVVSKEKPFLREDFARIYLHQSLFEYQKAVQHKQDPMGSSAGRFLNLSIEHGLLTVDQLRNGIEEYCHVWGLNDVTIIPAMEELYNSILKVTGGDYIV